MQPRKRMMIDIETLDTKPSAVVLSVGYCLFDRDNANWRKWPHSGVRFNIRDQLFRGRTISSETLSWWKEQNPNMNFMDLLTDAPVYNDEGENIFEGLDIDWFVQFITVVKRDYSAYNCEMWANSPSFDLVILEDYIRSNGKEAYSNVFGYQNVRDVRTLRALANHNGKIDTKAHGFDFKAHDPVHDCIYQGMLVNECLDRLAIE